MASNLSKRLAQHNKKNSKKEKYAWGGMPLEGGGGIKQPVYDKGGETMDLSPEQKDDIDAAYEFIKTHRKTGNEIIYNDTLHFGNGTRVYAFRQDAEASKVKFTEGEGRNHLFVTIPLNQVKKFLQHLMDADGYLAKNDEHDEFDKGGDVKKDGSMQDAMPLVEKYKGKIKSKQDIIDFWMDLLTGYKTSLFTDVSFTSIHGSAGDGKKAFTKKSAKGLDELMDEAKGWAAKHHKNIEKMAIDFLQDWKEKHPHKREDPNFIVHDDIVKINKDKFDKYKQKPPSKAGKTLATKLENYVGQDGLVIGSTAKTYNVEFADKKSFFIPAELLEIVKRHDEEIVADGTILETLQTSVHDNPTPTEMQDEALQLADGGEINEKAETIVQQLGGKRKLEAMAGAIIFSTTNGIQIILKSKRAPYVYIDLNGKDLYDVSFGKFLKKEMKLKVVSEFKDVQASELKPLIEKETELHLSLEEGGMLPEDATQSQVFEKGGNMSLKRGDKIKLKGYLPTYEFHSIDVDDIIWANDPVTGNLTALGKDKDAISKVDETTVAQPAIKIPNNQASVYATERLPFTGTNLKGKKLLNDDYVVLSFLCYPVWLYSAADGKWYGNKDKFNTITALHQSESRPDFNAEMLPLHELYKKLFSSIQKFDLGGPVQQLYPMSLDNALEAHG